MTVVSRIGLVMQMLMGVCAGYVFQIRFSGIESKYFRLAVIDPDEGMKMRGGVWHGGRSG
jgi:hypothetical protein